MKLFGDDVIYVDVTSFTQADVINGNVVYIHNGTAIDEEGSDIFHYDVTVEEYTQRGNVSTLILICNHSFLGICSVNFFSLMSS